MKPADFLRDIVDPSLLRLTAWTGLVSDDRARVLVMAIAGQETFWQHRLQVPVAYARSYWQFERGGGVAGLFGVVPDKLRQVCGALDIPYDPDTVFAAMAYNDTLACCMARLLLWTDPRPLPAVGQIEAGWNYYIANWRPGLPHRGTWDARYETSLAAMKGENP